MTHEQLDWLESTLDRVRPVYMVTRGGIITTEPETGIDSVPIMAKAGAGLTPRNRSIVVDWDQREVDVVVSDGKRKK